MSRCSNYFSFCVFKIVKSFFRVASTQVENIKSENLHYNFTLSIESLNFNLSSVSINASRKRIFFYAE